MGRIFYAYIDNRKETYPGPWKKVIGVDGRGNCREIIYTYRRQDYLKFGIELKRFTIQN